jgi:hypothetical protein
MEIAGKPVIGRQYKPRSIEYRLADGTYVSWNRPPHRYEEALQTAYLKVSESAYERYLRVAAYIWAAVVGLALIAASYVAV